MKKARLQISACVLFLAAGSVWAEALIGEIKWSQLPLLDEFGYDVSSETLVPSLAAADWKCLDPRPVIGVQWWGSYWISSAGFLTSYSDSFLDPSFSGGGLVLPDVVDAFNITFYDDVPTGIDPNMPWSHPDNVLLAQTIDIDCVSITAFQIIDRNKDSVIGNDGDEVVWQYYAKLTEPFYQVENTIYWLSIQAVNHIDNPDNVQWGWHLANTLWNDEAVQQGPSQLWGLDYEKKWVPRPDEDLAFQLEVIPEPSTLFLIGTGALLGIGFIRRRKM